eukprot:CAMPEP_0202402564 /NCGR_PEP_ID=MMETSP1128-20130828/4313_1 /ASSEMBLY_ACC=CAM_ASM_000463 /TAXON_ID=3047 /ORGANISM="Dunaliella tertiolecta, Strain CCMP1320" /LENGTH=478 /DNA_ID=CAMNT_0049006625 /DNA_START=672 /DNA_END=2110 /DNA_ORIENTATION=-
MHEPFSIGHCPVWGVRKQQHTILRAQQLGNDPGNGLHSACFIEHVASKHNIKGRGCGASAPPAAIPLKNPCTPAAANSAAATHSIASTPAAAKTATAAAAVAALCKQLHLLMVAPIQREAPDVRCLAFLSTAAESCDINIPAKTATTAAAAAAAISAGITTAAATAAAAILSLRVTATIPVRSNAVMVSSSSCTLHTVTPALPVSVHGPPRLMSLPLFLTHPQVVSARGMSQPMAACLPSVLFIYSSQVGSVRDGPLQVRAVEPKRWQGQMCPVIMPRGSFVDFLVRLGRLSSYFISVRNAASQASAAVSTAAAAAAAAATERAPYLQASTFAPPLRVAEAEANPHCKARCSRSSSTTSRAPARAAAMPATPSPAPKSATRFPRTSSGESSTVEARAKADATHGPSRDQHPYGPSQSTGQSLHLHRLEPTAQTPRDGICFAAGVAPAAAAAFRLRQALSHHFWQSLGEMKMEADTSGD